MPDFRLRFYANRDGRSPFQDWLDGLQDKVKIKCIRAVALLEDRGHELRRPHCDYLRNDIYELRVRYGSRNYRILYFFHGRDAVVLSHGCTKERVVPQREIDLAIRHRAAYLSDPSRHTFQFGTEGDHD